MGTALTILSDTVRRVQDGVTRDGLAGGFEAAQSAYADAGAARNGQAAGAADLNKWLIVIAAVLGAFLVWRAGRKLTGFAFAVFWVWFTMRGFRF